MPFGYTGHYLRIGPPGTGKTTSIANQVAEACSRATAAAWPGESPVCVCSLTRAAAAEAAGRDMPIPTDAVATVHAHGYRLLGRPAVVDPDSVAEWNHLHPAYSLSPDQFARRRTDDGYGDDLDTRLAGDHAGDDLYVQADLLRHQLMPIDDWDPAPRDFHQKWSAWKQHNGLVDFTDMISQAPDVAPCGAGLVIVDEAQDCSALERRTIDAWGRDAGAVVYVGDSYQALYTFRGADPDGMMAACTGDRRRVLEQSWRVPRAVHAAATAWVHNLSTWEPIEYRPRDADGHCGPLDTRSDDPQAAVQVAVETARAGQTCMVVATCGYMLGPILAELRAAGVPFSNPWRTRRGDWNPLAKRAGTSASDRIVGLVRGCEADRIWTVQQLAAWLDPLEAARVLVRGAKTEIAEVVTAVGKADRHATWDELVTWFQPAALADLWSYAYGGGNDAPARAQLVNWWSSNLRTAESRRFEYVLRVYQALGLAGFEAPPKVYVGTVHSFKGGEADDVILFTDLSPAAQLAWDAGTGPGQDSVIRVGYVGMTRARERLFVARAAGCGMSLLA